MKYICLGCIASGEFEGMTEDERHAVLDECFEHNDLLRANGHLVAEVPLQPPETALTLYWKNGKVATEFKQIVGRGTGAARSSRLRNSQSQSSLSSSGCWMI